MKKISLLAATIALSAAPALVQSTYASEAEIQEVLVSASLIPIAASRSANAITVIDSEQLKLRAALSVSDLLRDVPGLAVSRSGVQGSQTQIRARGSEANHLLVLIDGVEANDPSQSDELNWGTLSADDIERIEVIRGPQSSMRGSDAMAGVVNIVTRGAEQPFSAKLYTEAGSFSTQRYGFSVGANQDDFTVRLGVSDIQTDGDNISRTGDEKDGYENTSVNLKAGYAASESLSLSLSARQSDGMNEFDADDDWDGFVEDQDRVSEFRNSTVGLQTNYVSVDGRWQHKLLLAKSKHDNEAFADGEKGSVTASVRDQYQYIGSRVWADSQQQVSLLLEREEEEYKQFGGSADGNDANQFVDRDTDSIALEYRIDLTDSVTLAVGARHDNNEVFDDANTWKFEGVYRLDSSTRLRAAAGTAIKNPTFTELYGIYSGFESNPNLTPEESQSWELGVDKALLDDKLVLKATYFNAKLEDEIVGFYSPKNIDGSSKRKGLEVTSSWSISKFLALNASYTYTDSSQEGAAEVRRARHLGSLNLAWQVLDNLHINTNAQYNGSQLDHFFPPTPPYKEIVTLSDYTLLNINANYSASDKLDIYLRLDNLLDEDYEEVYGYQTLGFGASLGLRFNL
ncbi:MAG: TonB-dependent receptor plug domain-containing protein [Porticoccaceae bacterium]